jgi:transcriptional regulator with XRE-family HTH domain
MSHGDFAVKDHFNATVGEAIRAHRQRAKMTTDGLALASKVSHSTLKHAEEGHGVSLLVVAQLAEAMDCTIDDLVPIAALEKP